MFKNIVITLSLLLAAPTTLSASVIDAGWTQFQFGSLGSVTQVSFDLEEDAMLNVTDAFTSGDMFTVSANNILLGNTSNVPADAGINIGNDFDAAFASAAFSSGTWLLAAGSYLIDFTVFQSALGFSGGGAAYQLASVSAVPVPAAAWLFGSALLGFFGFARRKANA